MAYGFPDPVGAGVSFPLRVDATGRLALSRGHTEIAEALRLILGTTPGERPLRPEFGCAIAQFVFAPADAATAGQVAFEVRRSLERWEPRIDVLDVLVGPDPGQPDTLLIDIRYQIRDTDDPRNLVFPFYVIPSDGAEVVEVLPAAASRPRLGT